MMNQKIILAFCFSIASYLSYAADYDEHCCQVSSPSPYFVGCRAFETANLKLESISSAAQDISCYQAIYQDCGWRNSWFTDSSVYVHCDLDNSPDYLARCLEDGEPEPIFESQHERIQAKDIENFNTSEKNGFYSKPNSFPNYLILDRQTNELVGKFIFCLNIKSGRIEKGIYILSKFRGKGYAPETLTGIMKNVIDTALGQPFIITRRDRGIPEIYPGFKGIYSRISPWHNYPSLQANFKAGCAIRWMDYSPITFYPAGNETFLDPSNELLSFLRVIYSAHTIRAKLHLDSKDYTNPKSLFQYIKFFVENDDHQSIKDLLLDALCNLVNCGDESTVEFAQNALDI